MITPRWKESAAELIAWPRRTTKVSPDTTKKGLEVKTKPLAADQLLIFLAPRKRRMHLRTPLADATDAYSLDSCPHSTSSQYVFGSSHARLILLLLLKMYIATDTVTTQDVYSYWYGYYSCSRFRPRPLFCLLLILPKLLLLVTTLLFSISYSYCKPNTQPSYVSKKSRMKRKSQNEKRCRASTRAPLPHREKSHYSLIYSTCALNYKLEFP